MKDTFVLDACALIAILNDEDGADKVDYVIDKDGEINFYWIR